MDLQLDVSLGATYKSRSQIARACTEAWGLTNLYCPACPSDRLAQTPRNQPAIDYRCDACKSVYQLKGMARLGARVTDAAYSAMIAAIRSDMVPNLIVLHYGSDWCVQNLMLIPSFFFAESCISARPPLAPTARRSGWVGCEIMLNRIAPEGKLWMVKHGATTAADAVRRQYETVRPLSQLRAGLRGWALDVLRVVHKIKRAEFRLSDVYAFDAELTALHPNNKNVRPKIRQQLQILRDIGLLDFVEPGVYRLR